MTKEREALKLALEALGHFEKAGLATLKTIDAITAIREALSQPEQEPVAWLITNEKINNIQVDSIQRLIDRASHAHMTDIKLRINGQDEWYQADWLKHLTRTTPPHRNPLSDEQLLVLLSKIDEHAVRLPRGLRDFARAIEAAHGIKE